VRLLARMLGLSLTRRVCTMMGALCAVLAATSLALGAPTVDFNNFTYTSHPCGPKPVTMVKGHAPYDRGDVSFSVDMGAVFRGKLGNRDAAVVVLYCGLPVGSDSDAYAYAIDGSQATLLKSLGSVSAGSGGYPVNSWIHVTFRNGLLYVDEQTNPELYPGRWTVTTYRLSGNKLVAVNVLVHRRR
jgi:hypothetical protein